MTDRELLELAARAAGIYGTVTEDHPPVLLTKEWGIWNPLNSDGDALRLAVKLGILIIQQPSMQIATADYFGVMEEFDEPYGDDPCAATRRAIVRCAAEIGKEMLNSLVIDTAATQEITIIATENKEGK